MALEKDMKFYKDFTWERLWLFKESWAKHSVKLQNIYWDFKIFTKPSQLKVNYVHLPEKLVPLLRSITAVVELCCTVVWNYKIYSGKSGLS